MDSKNKAATLISNADCDKITNKKPVMFTQRAQKKSCGIDITFWVAQLLP